jgi:HK97 family phage major capsid protein
MNKKELLAQLTEKRKALISQIDGAETRDALDKLELDLRKVDLQIADLNAQIAVEENNNPTADPAARNASGAASAGGLNPIATYVPGAAGGGVDNRSVEDIYSSMEYRNAFKDFIVKGTPIPDKFVQKRANELTTVTDIGAVIPTTILNQVIEDMTIEGKILSRITQTAFQGGIAIPISEVNPTATWLASESVVSEEQKAAMNAKLTFSYHVLEAKIAIGLLSATVSLSIFENTVIKQLKKAMTRALETAIVSGSGVGQPLGFTKHSLLPSDQIVEIKEADMGTVKAWAGVEAKIPETAEDSVIYVMSKATWEKYLNGMVSTTGQKIGLGKINEKGQKILNGREVLTVDKFASYDAANVGDIFGAVVDLSQYMMNSNLAMYYKKYFNEDTNKWIHKALMIADGKMAIGTVGEVGSEKLVGAKGLIYLKKAATV